MQRLVQILTGRKSWIIALVALLLGAGVIGGVGQAERTASPLDSLPAGFESTEGQALLDELPEEDSQAAIILFTVEDEGVEQQLPELNEMVAAVAADVAPDLPAEQIPLIPAEDGSAAFSVLEVEAATATDARDAVVQMRADLSDAAPDGVSAQVTGPLAIQADLASVFDGANVTLLAATATVVALLLIITYRSPVLWIVPLTVVGIADQVAATAATYVLAGVGIPWDESTIGILSVLVFGAGTNYALLLISRYRDELRTHTSRHEAMAVALRRSSEAIIASGSTVVVGVLCLLLSVFPSTRGLGLACAVGIIVAMLGVMFVLPGALVVFGRWIFWPQVPREGQAVLAESNSLWRRIGDGVAKAPKAYIGGTLVLLIAMAFGLTQIRSGLAPEDQFLETPEAITASQRLAESFPAGFSDPLLVVVDLSDADGAQGGTALLEDLAGSVGEVDGVTQVTPGEPQDGIGQIQVVLEDEAGSTASQDTVAAVRDVVADSSAVTDAGALAYVTGGDASAVDADAGNIRDRWVVMPLILGLVLFSLMGLLRSVLAPIILISSVLATFCAALGISWWLFTGVFGFGAIDAGMPLLAFLFLVALGVDYNIFLITRTLEEAGVHGTRDGVLRALGATGGVITSAGILLAAVFAVLGVLPLVVLAQLGVVICIGVLLDTLVVRTVLVPAIVRVLGERFWWPRRVDTAGRHRVDQEASSDASADARAVADTDAEAVPAHS